MEKELTILDENNIRDKIHIIRGFHVMLDEDLARLYGVETKNINRAVKRNIERFPDKFMFKLTVEECDSLRFQIGTLNKSSLRSQIVTINKGRGTHRKYLPCAFTEQGVAMLSGVLRSETAVRISIQIMDAFVSMRRFIAANAGMFQRVDNVEIKLLEHDKKFEQVFDAIESKDIKPDKRIFFDGQIFDSYKFVSDIIRSAKKSIILIDNYVDDSVLTLFSKRNKNIQVTIYTKEISKQLSLDVQKYNSQYPYIEIKEFKQSHDRFIIIDGREVYHFGASLKDLGKKWFAFSKFDKEVFTLIDRLEQLEL